MCERNKTEILAWFDGTVTIFQRNKFHFEMYWNGTELVPIYSKCNGTERVPNEMERTTSLDGIIPFGAATYFRSRNLSEVQWSVTGQKGFVFFCLFLLGGTEREMSKNWGRSGVRQSSGNLFWKKTFALLTPACYKQSFKTAVENITDVLAGKIQTLE